MEIHVKISFISLFRSLYRVYQTPILPIKIFYPRDRSFKHSRSTGWPKKVSHYQVIKNRVKWY